MVQSTRRARALRGCLAALAAAVCAASAHAAENAKTGGPYVPTPQVVVDQMLRLANVGEKDFVIDLGSGDGVIVLTAAKYYKAGGLGVDIDADLVRQSNESAQRQGVADRVQFVQLDVFKANISKASVLTLYLLPGMMINLRPKIFNELKPGTRVVSHDYHFGDWRPDDSVSFDVPEKEAVTGVPAATVYLWIVPAKIAGSWQIKLVGGEIYELSLKQRFQAVEGSVTMNGKTVRPELISLRGNEFSFAVRNDKGIARFTGRVTGDAMEGTVELPGGKAASRWNAVRTGAGIVATE
jgi:phospholipid N-methyltransferase